MRRIYERVDKRKTHQRFSPHDFPIAGMPPEASAGVPKGAYRKYVPEGIQVPLRARAHKSEHCAGFMCVSYKGKTLQAFFDSRLIRAISSSAEKSRASPTKEKRGRRFSTSDFFVKYTFAIS